MAARLALFIAALFLSASPGVPAAAQPAAKRIALTFDEVPRGRAAFFTPDKRTARLIAGLHRAGVRQAAERVLHENPAPADRP